MWTIEEYKDELFSNIDNYIGRGSLLYSPLQTSVWYKFISKYNQNVGYKTYILYNNEWKIPFIFQTSPVKSGFYLWGRHLPVPEDMVLTIKSGDKLNMSGFLNDLREGVELLKETNAFWVSLQFRVPCNVINDLEHKYFCELNTRNYFDVRNLRINGYYRSAMHDYDFEDTVIIDLQKELKFSSSTRRYYKKAIKQGLMVVESDNIKPLVKMLDLTAKRKKYREVSSKYLIDKWLIFSKSKMVRLFYVKKDNRFIYGALYLGDKDYIVYNHGGGLTEYLHYNPAYLLHGYVISKLSEQGYKYFDFGGVGGYDKSHPLYANSQIKYRFGGERMNFMHTVDYPFKKLMWGMWYAKTFVRNYKSGWYN